MSCISSEDIQSQITALRTAISTGEKRVTVGDRTVEYQSIPDMQAALDRLCRDYQVSQGKPKVVIATWSGTR